MMKSDAKGFTSVDAPLPDLRRTFFLPGIYSRSVLLIYSEKTLLIIRNSACGIAF